MCRHKFSIRFMALFLTVTLLCGMIAPKITALDIGGGNSSSAGGKTYDDDESVRVSIVLEDLPTIAVPYSLEGIAANADAMEYRHKLRQIQDLVVRNIETYALDGEELDVVWNLTLVANIISANVEYGKIDTIREMDGVVDVFVEERVYLDVMDTSETVVPAMAGSSSMTDFLLAHAAGFTGAGSRVAIIDTGIDTDHRSFDAGAFEYSLRQLEKQGRIRMDELDLMTAATIEGVLSELNILDKSKGAEGLYVSSKLPFAYNYAEPGTDVNHHAGQASPDMEHGSHVAGIAAANAYVPDNENKGKYLYAADTVGVCGTAPDAQILTMRVFDRMGGAYESTYMVAIEDAIILGADSINLSLGTAVTGFNRANAYTDILEDLVNSGSVCVASAGNNGTWADYDQFGGYILSKDVNFNTLGNPGSLSSTFSIGSVDNSHVKQSYFTVDGQWIFYNTVQADADLFSSVAGKQQYVYLPGDAFADAETIGALGEAVKGKIVVCQRGGDIPLVTKAHNAAEAGAIAVIIVNNEGGTLNPVLSGYKDGIPVITVSKTDGAFLKNAAKAVLDSTGGTLYYQGEITVNEDSADEKSGYYTMSFFSSFGVPGNLSLAPDIVAPGGNILSVNGRVAGGQDYVSFSGTSMAAPQVTGMSAVLAQYIRDLKLTARDRNARFLIQNLLMSTAVPFKDEKSDGYYPVFQQGSGLANLERALNAQALILMDAKATPQYSDGKVKAEFGDDSQKTGVYRYDFIIENFSGKTNSYILSTEMFTQALKRNQKLSNGETVDFLDKLTTPLSSKAVYTVNGVTVNAGEVFTVAAYEKVPVHVEITLTDKDQLKDYPSGAYVEGYTFITGVADKEGVRDVEYSIPLIGFYGDWGDPSMFDYASYAGRLYGEETLSYIFSFRSLNNIQYANYFSITNSVTDESRIYTGNPYTVEDAFPVGRGAIRSTDIISGYSTILIRSAAAAAVYLTNDKGEWIDMGNVRYQVGAASNYKGRWMTTSVVIPFSRTPASMNLKENDMFHVNVVAVPEYYETEGEISAEDLKALIENEKIGKGTTLLAATLTVDDTPPEIISVDKDDDGNLIVKARDNHYIAYMSVTDRSGTVVYGSCVPDGEEGGTVTCTFDLKDANIGPTCVIFVGDYAANSVKQYYSYNQEYPSLSGKLGGYIHAGNNGYDKAWTVIDPSDIQNGGSYRIQPIAYHGGKTVTAAAYVDGYVYQVIGSKLYTSPVNEIDDISELVDLERFRLHSVYALSYNRTDHMLYALTGENTLWRIDPKNGNAEKVTQITVSGRTDGPGHITAMAIDSTGNFYGITYYESGSSLLVKWTAAQFQGEQLALTGTRLSGEMIRDRFGSMAYDAEKNVLYLAESYADNVSSSYNRLLCIDLSGMSVKSASTGLNYAVRGLYAVPAEDDGDDTLTPTETIQKLEFLQNNLRMLVSGQEDFRPLITPWTAKDQTLIWETSDEKVVTVKNGIVTAVGTGTATVTVSAAADSRAKDTCTITVEEIPPIRMSAVVYDKNKNGYLASYDVADPKALEKQHILPSSYAFYSGGLSNGMLYMHDGYFMYTLDPETCNVRQVMMFPYLEYTWSDVTQTPQGAPSMYGVAGLYYNEGSFWGMYSENLRMPLSGKLDFDSPAVTIAYIEDDEESAMASRYYILLENGALYRVSCPIPIKYEFLGMVPGVDLKGVSDVTQGISASMWYDRDSGYLILNSRLKGENAKVQLIDPGTLRVMSTTEFSEDIWYTTAAYKEDTNGKTTANTSTNATTTVYDWETLLAAENTGTRHVASAEPKEQKESHSVYEGIQEIFSAPFIRPYAAGSAAARLESTHQTYATLQLAIAAAHAQILSGSHEPQTVTLLSNVNESVRVVWIRGHIDYDYDLTIDLNGYTVTGTGDGPVLWFEAGGLGGSEYGFHVTIEDGSKEKSGTITGGTGKSTVFSGTSGGGIYFSASTVHDSLTINGGNIRENHVMGKGGAIAMSGNAAAQLVINGGSISNNTAANGAVSGRWITVTGGVITENHASAAGGGLCLWGTGTQKLEIADHARVYGNTADGMGDDIAVVSQRGGVTYDVSLSDPAEWTDGPESDPDAAWCVDGTDGIYDHSRTKPVRRYDEAYPQKLSRYTIFEKGSDSPAYGIAVKMADYIEDENLYTVTYTDGAEGTVFKDQTHSNLKAGSDTPLFNGTGVNPTRTGYRFTGWDPEWSDIVTGDVIYTAKWELITVESVKLDRTELTLNEGEDAVLNATVLPSDALQKTVRWSIESSGDVAVILSFDGNRVTVQAVGAGTATVIAEINGLKAICTITVNHVWEEPTFEWQKTAGGYSVTASRKCAMGHTQTVTADAVIKNSVPPGCTENGTDTYTATVFFDEDSFTVTKDVEVSATGHSYTNYRYNDDATYWADGTETADCDNHCGAQHTRTAKGTKLTDTEAPTATITVNGNRWSAFLHKITFGLFFHSTQNVTIEAKDAGVGLGKVYYYLSHTEIAIGEIENISVWTEYQKEFRIDPNNKWIIYVKAVDLLGNTGYYSSDGIVLDAAAPVITGITNGALYYEPVTVTVEDEYINAVTVNGVQVQLNAKNQFVLEGKDGTYTVIATDRAGNRTVVIVTLATKTLTRIEVTKKPAKTEYIQGSTFDPAGMEVTLYYNNGTSEVIRSGWTLSYDFSQAGQRTVTVSYGGKTTSFTVTVKSRVPSSITSNVYSVSGGYISKIAAGTTAAQLLSGINEKDYCKIYNGNTEVSGNTKIGTGMEVRLMDGSTVKDKVMIVVTGDVNGDGEISITDLLAVKSHLLKKSTLTGAAAKAADTSGDKAISITDFIQIKAHLLGKEKIQAQAC